MKKYSIVYAFSFLSYFIVLFAIPYISAQVWADVCLLIFILSVLYQLCYLVFLRKRDGVNLGRAIARFFLYSLLVLSMHVIIQYGDMYIHGYQPRIMFTGDLITTYYGLDAWKNSVFTNILFLPILFITIIYGVSYIIISKAIKNKK